MGKNMRSYKRLKGGNRYNHWFWNSYLINWLGHTVGDFSTWLWHKQYGKPQ